MRSGWSQDEEIHITLQALEVTEAQQAFVAELSYYLAPCCYGE